VSQLVVTLSKRPPDISHLLHAPVSQESEGLSSYIEELPIVLRRMNSCREEICKLIVSSTVWNPALPVLGFGGLVVRLAQVSIGRPVAVTVEHPDTDHFSFIRQIARVQI